jgi:hypothetical protein
MLLQLQLLLVYLLLNNKKLLQQFLLEKMFYNLRLHLHLLCCKLLVLVLLQLLPL